MNNPRISIITVTYNNQSTIEATIKSVLNQTYKNIQYIIIDGQSKDNTLSIIRKYSQQIDIIISEPDEGAYYAINKGILYATGDVIGILHADDFYADEKVIEKVVKAFNSFNSSVVYGDLLYVDRNDENKIIRYWQSCQYNSTLLKKGWMPPHPTLFISKEKINKIGNYNTKYKIAADYDFMIRVLKSVNFDEVFYIPNVLIKMRIGGISNKKIKNIIRKSYEDFIIIKKHKIGGINTLILKNISKFKQFV